jgi:hypothetical protein
VLLLTEAAPPAVVTPTPECEDMCIPAIHLSPKFTYYWTIMEANSQRLVSAAQYRKHHHPLATKFLPYKRTEDDPAHVPVELIKNPRGNEARRSD